MRDARVHGAKKNIFVSIGCQLVTLMCGIIVPKLMIDAFGSEAYGATVSIGQFLSYIALLEGGIGGVVRAALYRPLAEGDAEAISAVMAEVKHFFRIIAYIFGAYTLLIAFTFNSISGTEVFDQLSTFLLVASISLSTFGQYFIGISNMILLQAAQKSYITNMVNIAGLIVNTILIVLLVHMGCGIIAVKLVSGVVFALKPVALWVYVRRNYRIHRVPRQKTTLLAQKWSGIGQHIAFFLHSNTDVVILTCFANLKAVAVYSVYNMVVSNIQNLAASFIAGMEALFGDMLAKGEKKQLNHAFETYETIISAVAVVLFSVTTVMIVPFVRIYTAGITDANYEVPVFAWLLILSALLYCLRMPYHSVVIAAGHFKQTQSAAYGEVVINVGLSILLVRKLGLVGVAIGTVAATTYRLLYYVGYLSRNVLNRNAGHFVRQTVLNGAIYATIVAAGMKAAAMFDMENYGVWVLCGAAVGVLALGITLAGNLLFNRQNCRLLLAIGSGKR